MTLDLLRRYGLEHTCLGARGRSMTGLVRELAVRTGRLVSFAAKFRPDVMAAIAGTFIAPAGRLLGIPTVTFTDTEHAGLSNRFAFPLTTHLVVPECYNRVIKRTHLRYRGYHELAYLHPDRFSPDPSVLGELGVREGERYAVLRFVSWQAAHDAGHTGLSPEMKRRAVELLSRRVRVFISSENELPPDLAQYRLPTSPERIHHVLAFASLLFGESATMASECAVLGTPSVFIDNDGRGYTDDQERVYGLVRNFTESPEDQERAIEAGVEVLDDDGLDNRWDGKRKRLIDDSIDVTAYIVDIVERAGSRTV